MDIPLSTLTLWSWWQNVPLSINPIAFDIGGLPVYWYALFFLFGSLFVYILTAQEFQSQSIFTKKQFTDFAFGIFASAILGGKLGYLTLYWWPFVYGEESALLPQNTESIVALPGMSFVGGLLAVSVFIFLFSKKNQHNFFTLTDTVALYIPIAIFFGRLGSFFQNELWGRVTLYPWGMYFPAETVLRHPSTLYAAFIEGLLLFYFLFLLKKKKDDTSSTLLPGLMTAYFCMGYGVLRFISEYFREPDSQIGFLGALTMNQFFTIIIIVLGIIIFSVKKRENTVY